MKNGIVVIAADGHAVDYEPVYRERLPAANRERATIYPAHNFDRTRTANWPGSDRRLRRKTSPTTAPADRRPKLV